MHSVDVYLSQEHIDWANENKRLQRFSFDVNTQCPVANALWDHFGGKTLISVAEASYYSIFDINIRGSIDGIGQSMIEKWTYGGVDPEPGWFTVYPG